MNKQIYIKRLLRYTKEGQGFYCSQVFKINEGLDKPIKEPLLRNNKPLFFLERQKVAIPKMSYSLGADFTGKHQWVKILNVPERFITIRVLVAESQDLTSAVTLDVPPAIVSPTV